MNLWEVAFNYLKQFARVDSEKQARVDSEKQGANVIQHNVRNQPEVLGLNPSCRNSFFSWNTFDTNLNFNHFSLVLPRGG